MTARVSSRKNEFGEWVVKVYNADGSRRPQADYFTDDRADADATAKAISEGDVG